MSIRRVSCRPSYRLPGPQRPDPPGGPARAAGDVRGAGVGGIETFFFDAVEALHEAGLAQLS